MELLDIYDKDRRPTGKVAPRGQAAAGEYFLVVHVCLFNREGELLIQKRHQRCRRWPGLWDVSVGGASQAGESSSQAARRECFEELGYRVDLSDRGPHFTVHFDYGFDDYYLVHADVRLDELRLQPEEVQDVRWAPKEAVLDLISAGQFLPYHAGLVEVLFDMARLKGSFHSPI